ncbi:MAG: hypothetical protein ABJM43_18825 [Paracoccaceae bacterium]
MHHGRTNDIVPDVLKLYGERCSGTNYVETLIDQNFPKLTSRRRYNWEKHNYVNPPFVSDTMLGIVVEMRNLKLGSQLKVPNDAKGKGRLKPYMEFSDADRDFVLGAFDLEQERYFGYDY